MNTEINYCDTLLFGEAEYESNLAEFGNFSKITNNRKRLIAFLEEQGTERFTIRNGNDIIAVTTTHSGIFADGTNFSIYCYRIEDKKCGISIRVNGNRKNKHINNIHKYIVNRLATSDNLTVDIQFNSSFRYV